MPRNLFRGGMAGAYTRTTPRGERNLMKNPQTFEILMALMLASTVLIIHIAQHMVYYDEKMLEYEHLAEEAKYPAKKTRFDKY